MLPVSVGASEVLDARAVRAERSCHTRPQKFGIFFIPFGWFYYTGGMCYSTIDDEHYAKI